MKNSSRDRYEINELQSVKLYLEDMKASTFGEEYQNCTLVKDRHIPKGFNNHQTLGRYQGEVIFKWFLGKPVCIVDNSFSEELIAQVKPMCKRGKGIESQVFFLCKEDNILRVASSLDCFTIKL